MLSEYNELLFQKVNENVISHYLTIKNTAIPETIFVLCCRPLTPIITKTFIA